MFAGRISGFLSPFSQSVWITAAISRNTPRVRWNFTSVDQSVYSRSKISGWIG
jgi:hypothetical protein